MIPIVNAARLTVAQASTPMPSMRSTIMGWFRQIELVRIVKQTVDHQTKEVAFPITTSGTVQPFSRTQLQIKPEGERSWKWWMIHATPDLQLQTDDVITHKGTKLRIMSQYPYEDNGYVQYDAVEDYAPAR